jgi:uncharacterized protein YndB with AHSA1/START domain/DNA-binding transcriptional ArsR family regulator
MDGDDPDIVFKALADKTRRALLDSLRERNGLTLGELYRPLAMARQSATQHLEILEAANLIATVRRGREKLHYLNPVPLWDIHERWIERFEPPRLRALHAIKRQAEEDKMAGRPTFVYVTYIESSAERVWEALTQPEVTAAYWGVMNLSNWEVGSPWEHQRANGSGIADVGGTVIESTSPHRLVMTWGPSGETSPDKISKVTFEIEPYHEIVRLMVIHEDLDDDMFAGISKGWPAVLANLKTLLETGHVLSRSPVEMAHQRTAFLAKTATQTGMGASDGDER